MFYAPTRRQAYAPQLRSVDQAVELIVRHGKNGLTLERVSQMIANTAADLARVSS